MDLGTPPEPGGESFVLLIVTSYKKTNYNKYKSL
jgi:hypothetical protein